MKRIYFISCVTLFIVMFSVNLSAQSYKIKVKVNGMHGDSVLLGNYYGEKLYSVDTCVLDAKGAGIFNKKKNLEGGLYVILFPTRKSSFFEIIINGESLDMSFETDTLNYVLHMKVKGSKDNELFYAFQKRMNAMKDVAMAYQKRYTTNKDNKDSAKYLGQKLDSMNKVKDKYWETEIKNNPTTFYSKIVNAMSYINIPELNIDKNTKSRDSIIAVYRYNYNVNHYFDNIDFTDPRLLRTPFVEQRLNEYFEKNIIQNFDSISNAAIRLVEKSRINKDYFKYFVVTCTNYFLTSKIVGMDAVFVSLAEKYYQSGEATWADTSIMKNINKYVNQYKPNLLGKIAHDLKLETPTGEFVSLHQVNAKYTVLVFYETTCGHCKKEIPAMHELYAKWKQLGVEVYAVNMLVDEKEWKEFIEKNSMDDWINVFDRYQQSGFRRYYGVTSTPFVYLLDEKKTILAKKISLEDLDKFIDRLNNKDVKK